MPEAPATLADLSHLPRWVVWRNERRNGRMTKVPLHPSGRNARSNSPADWVPRAAAEAATSRLVNGSGGGVGVMLGALQCGTTLAGIDLDTCRDAGGTLSPWAEAVRARLGTYCEVSPSGTGAKLFFTMQPAEAAAARAALGSAGRKWSARGGDHPPGIEIYLADRYFAVTGAALGPEPIRSIGAVDLAWVARHAAATFGAKPAPPPAEAPLDPVGAPPPPGRDDSRSARAFRLAAAMRAAGADFPAFVAALADDPDLAAWKAEKGDAAGGRELHRAWENTVPQAAPWPALDVRIATAEAAPPPPWPGDLFPGDWPGILDRAAEAAGAPVDFVGASLLAAAGACIGNVRWAAPWGTWREPPILWTCLVGNPSSGKSPALATVTGPLTEMEADMAGDMPDRVRAWTTKRQEAQEHRARWEKEVKEAVKRGLAPPMEPLAARAPDAPTPPRVFSTDPTIEAAARLAEANPRGLLLLRDELAGWLGGMDRYGNGAGGADRAFWLQAWNGAAWQPDRVKDAGIPVRVPHLTWGIVGGAQPDRVASLMLAGDDDGLAARFLYTWPAPRKPVRPRHDDAGAVIFERLGRLRRLPWDPPGPVLMRFSEDAADALQSWREEVAQMESDATGLLVSWTGKLPGFAVRIALVFELLAWTARSDGAPPAAVSGDALARAVAFLRGYAAPMARRVFGEAALPQAERDARRLARWYLAHPSPRPAVLNAKALRRVANGPGIADAERMDAALGELSELGWCRPALARDGALKGRQRKDWQMNPAAVEAP